MPMAGSVLGKSQPGKKCQKSVKSGRRNVELQKLQNAHLHNIGMKEVLRPKNNKTKTKNKFIKALISK